MALQKPFETRYGVGGNYININPPQLSNKTNAFVIVNYYKDRDARDSGLLPYNAEMNDIGTTIERIIGFQCWYQFIYNLESADNIYKQAYDFLNTLPEFEGSVDV